jgi:glycosyltransferase involved in cell wall biosynthesis
MSFFPAFFDNSEHYDVLPADFLNLRHRGVKIGYTVCGCLDGVAQSSVQRWSGACDKCVWQHDAAVCSDRRNLAWGHKVQSYCDLIATEGFPALDFQDTEKCYREPLTSALDPGFWSPDLVVPERYRIPREPGELVVCHAVGNFQLRSRNGRNLKGSGAVVEAVERLKREGMKVRLEFLTNIPNIEARFVQIQADVIVDQLNYGRYGAMAREGLMLGKPTICFLHKEELSDDRRLTSIEECPLVSATEHSVYDVLKTLLSDPEARRRIGSTSREFALKWHSADACAARFERVYDSLVSGAAPALCEHV